MVDEDTLNQEDEESTLDGAASPESPQPGATGDDAEDREPGAAEEEQGGDEDPDEEEADKKESL